MTTNTNYYTGRNYDDAPIPTREEFHRYTSNLLTEADFCTNYPCDAGFQTNRVANAISWTYTNEKNKNCTMKCTWR